MDVQARPETVRLYLLGGFRVERGGVVVSPEAWNQRSSPKDLLKILALRAGHRIHRHELLDQLWPGVDLPSSLNRLGKALHAARRALQPELLPRGGSIYVPLQDDVLFLNPELVRVDVDEFEEAAHRALTSDDLERYRAAMAAYGGELLPEDRYEEWTLLRRDALQSLYLRVLQGFATRLHRAGDVGQAITVWQQAVNLDPLFEDAHRALMLLHAALGNRVQALRQYETCRAILSDELGTEPSLETEEAYHAIRAGKARRMEHPTSFPSRAVSDVTVESAPALPLPSAVSEQLALPLVGREQALALMREHLSDAVQGRGRVVLVRGEAGVGKSRLVAAVAAGAADAGALVLWGAGYGSETPILYGPFVDALEGYISSLPAERRNTFAVQYSLLARLLPSLTSFSGTWEEMPQVVHGQLLAAFTAALAELSGRRPLMLVLDDLHAADGASLQLLQYLARASAGYPWLIVGTYRQEELLFGSAVQHCVSAVMRQGIARQIVLPRLAAPDIARLLGDRLPGGAVSRNLARQIYGLSLGNPLFAEELLASLRDHSMLLLEDGEWIASPVALSWVPGRVQDLVAARVAALGPHVVRVLSLAAVLGMEWIYDRLQAAAEIAFPNMDEELVLAAVDAAVERHMVEERGPLYVFRHPLVHAVLLQQLTRSRRLYYHRAIALVEGNAPDGVRVRHEGMELPVAWIGRIGE